MAKKKNDVVDFHELFLVPEEISDQEAFDLAEYFTYLMAEVSPAIDKGLTFEIIYEALHMPPEKELAQAYGKQIRDTALHKPSDSKH